jgi:hypothetical protein
MINTELRLATPQDMPAILTALQWMLDNSPAPQMKMASLMEAELSIRNAMHEGNAWIIQGYLIVVDVGRVWYSGERFLIEQIILRIEKTGTQVQAAIGALDQLADHYKCNAIAVGDTQIGHMTPLYQDHGYVTLGTQLFKEIRQHGLST